MSDHSSISDGSCGSDHDELIDGESDSGAASPPLSDDEADGDDGDDGNGGIGYNGSGDCLLCMDPIDIFAIGRCNHRSTCFKCSLRMRQLYKSYGCPLCRKDVRTVVFTRDTSRNFGDFDRSNLPYRKKFHAHLDGDDIGAALDSLWAFRCPFEGCTAEPLPSLNKLKQHVKKTHNREFCNTCLKFKKVFIGEQEIYTKSALRAHVRTGKGETNFTGHPYCRFCRRSFFDDEHMWKHMADAHFQCSLCEAEGLQFEYYATRDELQHHMQSNHWVCNMPECLELQVVAFRTEADLNAHTLSTHADSLSPAERRQLRQISIDVQFGGGSGGGSGSGAGGGRGHRGNRGGHGGGHGGGYGGRHNNHNNHNNHNHNNNNNNNNNRNDRNNRNNSHQSGNRGTSTAVSGGASGGDDAFDAAEAEERRRAKLKKRNQELVRAMKDALGGDAAEFARFTKISKQLQRGAIDCVQYYNNFVAIFGVGNTAVFFPELVDLLPDPDKAGQLEAIHASQQQREEMFPTLSGGGGPPVAGSAVPPPANSLLRRKRKGQRIGRSASAAATRDNRVWAQRNSKVHGTRVSRGNNAHRRNNGGSNNDPPAELEFVITSEYDDVPPAAAVTAGAGRGAGGRATATRQDDSGRSGRGRGRGSRTGNNNNNNGNRGGGNNAVRAVASEPQAFDADAFYSAGNDRGAPLVSSGAWGGGGRGSFNTEQNREDFPTLAGRGGGRGSGATGYWATGSNPVPAVRTDYHREYRDGGGSGRGGGGGGGGGKKGKRKRNKNKNKTKDVLIRFG